VIYTYAVYSEEGLEEHNRIGAWNTDDAESLISDRLRREYGDNFDLYTFFLLPDNTLAVRVPLEVQLIRDRFFEELGLTTLAR
jgi:hypothetical protein